MCVLPVPEEMVFPVEPCFEGHPIDVSGFGLKTLRLQLEKQSPSGCSKSQVPTEATLGQRVFRDVGRDAVVSRRSASVHLGDSDPLLQDPSLGTGR